MYHGYCFKKETFATDKSKVKYIYLQERERELYETKEIDYVCQTCHVVFFYLFPSPFATPHPPLMQEA